MLSHYIHDYHWNFPADVIQSFPTLRSLVSKAIIPTQAQDDSLIWNHSTSSSLSLKEAYLLKKRHFPKVKRVKTIWSTDFPPSRSLLVWRLMLDKLPTDENLSARGCSFPSMCSLCNNHEETSFHLFFECVYAINLWCWLASMLNRTLHFQSLEDMWSICNNSWNPQCRVVITAAMINIIKSVWFARKERRFKDKKVYWKTSLATVISNTALCVVIYQKR